MGEHRSPGRITGLLGLLVGSTVLGSSAIAVALPDVAATLDLDTAATAWVLAAFGLTFAISTALFGRLVDLHGLRWPLRTGVLLFVLGALLSASAPSFGVLIGGRLLQGAGAGAVPVVSTGILSTLYQAQARGQALGRIAAIVSIVSGSGPLIGGVVAELVGWRMILALPALVALMVEPVARRAPWIAPQPQRVDWTGAALTGVSVGALLVLVQGPGAGLPPAAMAGLGLTALLGGALMARHVRRRPEGFVPRAVLAAPGLVPAALAGLTLFASYLGLVLASPLLLAERGWRPVAIGLLLLPAAVAGSVTARAIGGTVARVGQLRVTARLAVGSTVGLLVAALGAGAPIPLLVGLGLVAIGFAGGQVALLDAVPGMVAPSVRGAAFGTFQLVFFLGGALGAATVGGLAEATGLSAAVGVLAVLPALGVVAARVGRARASAG